MSLITNFADDSSVASTSSDGTVPSPSDLSSSESAPSSVAPSTSSTSSSSTTASSRVSAVSRKRRAANILPSIGLESSGSSTRTSTSESSASDAEDGSKRVRSSQDSGSRPFDQVAQIECSQGSNSTPTPVCGNKKIEHHVEGYEMISTGKEITAVHCETKAIMQVTMLSDKDAVHFERISRRLREAERFSNRSRASIRKMTEMILPKGCEFRKSESNGRFYVFSPMYHNTLHGLVMQRKDLSNIEEQMQPLYLQIVELVDFCHEIGILMRDLRLRKFVFVDKKLTQLRLGSVLDVSICEDPLNDILTDRQGCPAYVAPEILCTEDYAGRPADVWALGILIFVLLTGRYPFYDVTPMKLFNKIRVARFALPPHARNSLSPSAKALFHILLRKNPADRPTVHDLLAVPWVRGERVAALERFPGERPFFASFSASSALAQFMNVLSSTAAAVGSRNITYQEMIRHRRQQDRDHVVPEVPSAQDRIHIASLGLRAVVPTSRSNSPVAISSSALPSRTS